VWTTTIVIDNEWTFFSNYAHVLVCLAQNPHALLREVADRVGVTERTAMRLINQLDEAGILDRVKQGRRNVYKIRTSKHLRHPLEAHCTIEELLTMILQSDGKSTTHSPGNGNSEIPDSDARDLLTNKPPREANK
jgi:predicted transcriptional regulator of viral defense system